MEPIQTHDLDGTLGRTTLSGDRAILRFYPWAFSLDASAKPVLVVEFVNPAFNFENIAKLRDCEVWQVALHEGRIECLLDADDDPLVLTGESVTAVCAPYDVEDLLLRIQQLEKEQTKLYREILALRGKDQSGLALTIELMRRAEVKAGASNELAERQKAAIAVLKRLITHFQQSSD